MQPGGRSSNRASLAGIDRLIPLFVVGIATQIAFDVGRQRRLADLVNDLVQRFARFKFDEAHSVIQQLNNFALEPGSAEDDSRTFAQPSRWAREGLPNIRSDLPDKK